MLRIPSAAAGLLVHQAATVTMMVMVGADGGRRLCENLGVAFKPQLIKLQSANWATVTMMVMVGADGKCREQAIIDAETIPMWPRS